MGILVVTPRILVAVTLQAGGGEVTPAAVTPLVVGGAVTVTQAVAIPQSARLDLPLREVIPGAAVLGLQVGGG